MRRDNSGIILITSLWILTILSILAISIGYRISIEARLSRYNMDRLKALYLAKSGVVECELFITNENSNYDSIYENGVSLSGEEKLSDIFMNVKPEGITEGHFDVSYSNAAINNFPGMMDEERKININKASQEVLTNLLQIVSQEGSTSLTPSVINQIVASIIAWRSPGPGDDDSFYESRRFPINANMPVSAQ